MKRSINYLGIVTAAIFVAALAGCVSSSRSAGDAGLAGTHYHSKGSIVCSMGGNQPAGYCPAGVQRRDNGSTVVTITKPDGQTRSIFFHNGLANGYDGFDGGPRMNATKEGNVSIIRIGRERYEIPDTVVYGGY